MWSLQRQVTLYHLYFTKKIEKDSVNLFRWVFLFYSSLLLDEANNAAFLASPGYSNPIPSKLPSMNGCE
ncbi:MAG: hypothetical protein ACJAU0_001918 [Flavobacteriales bacterium]|jgi:hypothetical protein